MHGSKLVGGGCMNENAIHGAPNKGNIGTKGLSKELSQGSLIWLEAYKNKMDERKTRNSYSKTNNLVIDVKV